MGSGVAGRSRGTDDSESKSTGTVTVKWLAHSLFYVATRLRSRVRVPLWPLLYLTYGVEV